MNGVMNGVIFILDKLKYKIVLCSMVENTCKSYTPPMNMKVALTVYCDPAPQPHHHKEHRRAPVHRDKNTVC